MNTFALFTGPRKDRIHRGAAIIDDVAPPVAASRTSAIVPALAQPPSPPDILPPLPPASEVPFPVGDHSTSSKIRLYISLTFHVYFCSLNLQSLYIYITMEDVLAAPNAYVRATETAQYVRSQLPKALQNPKVAIVCGSGLGGLADTIESGPKVELSYGSIPNFPQSTGQSKKEELEG
jgi:hypothetical protein